MVNNYFFPVSSNLILKIQIKQFGNCDFRHIANFDKKLSIFLKTIINLEQIKAQILKERGLILFLVICNGSLFKNINKNQCINKKSCTK